MRYSIPSRTVSLSLGLVSTLLVMTACQPDDEPLSRVPANAASVEVIPQPAEQRVDVMVNGALFTSYLYADSISVLKKPVLYPLMTPNGTAVTRSYPLETGAGERVDHPHHIGMWLNYGDVNGYDFWNNSDQIGEERAPQMGTIFHREVVDHASGPEQGSLTVTADWLTPDRTLLLTEETRYVFHASDTARIVDRITTLTAQNEAVALTDNKEGMLGIRVRRALELPSDSPVLLSDANGQPMAERIVDSTGVTGNYLSSEGITGGEVWGTRARWMKLAGVVEGDSASIVILDHPENVGYPTYWHARDYGLFAANPLGQAALSDGAETLNYGLNAGESVTFKYRVLILSSDPSSQEIESAFEQFTSTL